MREAKTRLQEVKKDRGYGKTDGSDKKGTAAKKQSGKHPCFDCGLPGHWAGDPECQKPGQNLGRKSPPKKAKQMKMIFQMWKSKRKMIAKCASASQSSLQFADSMRIRATVAMFAWRGHWLSPEPS